MGVTGLETAFSSLYTELVMPGTIDARPADREARLGGAAPFDIEPSEPGAGSDGQPLPRRPRSRMGGRRGRLREPLAQLLVRRTRP